MSAGGRLSVSVADNREDPVISSFRTRAFGQRNHANKTIEISRWLYDAGSKWSRTRSTVRNQEQPEAVP
jgi:hypothetical protein